jgi:hypothetical protein
LSRKGPAITLFQRSNILEEKHILGLQWTRGDHSPSASLRSEALTYRYIRNLAIRPLEASLSCSVRSLSDYLGKVGSHRTASCASRMSYSFNDLSRIHYIHRPQTTPYVSQCVSPWSPIHESPQETFALEVGNSEPQPQSAPCHDQSREVLPLEVVWVAIQLYRPKNTHGTSHAVGPEHRFRHHKTSIRQLSSSQWPVEVGISRCYSCPRVIAP